MEISTSASERSVATDLSIAELELRTRAENALLNGGVETVSDALTFLEGGDEALLDLNGFGPAFLADLKDELQQRGFNWSEEKASVADAELDENVAEEDFTEDELVDDRPSSQLASAEGTVEEKEYEESAQEEAINVPIWQRLTSGLDLGRWVYGLILGVGIVALLLFLILPPVSILQRVGITGFTKLDADNGSCSHPDGITLSISPEESNNLRVRLESVPRLELLEGSAGSELREAAIALPEHLVVKSPLYKIKTRGEATQPLMIDVVVPNNAEPWETLDLYTWTGDDWEWVGSDLHTEAAGYEFVRARVSDAPENVLVAQSGPITSTVSTYWKSGDVAGNMSEIDEINPTGLLLGTMGGFAGQITSVPPVDEAGNGPVVMPTLRNWAPGATVNRGLLADLLNSSELQDTHIANIVRLCEEYGFDGVDIDYRGVATDDRDAYSTFIQKLADTLHAKGLRLTVNVERPTPVDGGWETGGYDWGTLADAVDGLKVPFPEDPTAYVGDGRMRRLLNWATAQAPRYKLRMLISSLSTEQSSDTTEISVIDHISLEQALVSFGEIMTLGGIERVEPSDEVTFGLSGALLSISPQEAASTYRLEYKGNDGKNHTVWLGTAASLATKLHWAQNYHLGGVAVADMFDPGNADNVMDVVASYPTVSNPPKQKFEINWTIKEGEKVLEQQVSPITDPAYTWKAPDKEGSYSVSASISGFDHGSVTITVARPEPVITQTEDITATEELARASHSSLENGAEENEEDGEAEENEEDAEESEEEVLDAGFVADVSIPDNTQLENGEEFEKTWRLKNGGTKAWPEDTVLAFASGDQMEAPESVEVGAVDPGDNADVSVKMKAPAEAGSYKGVWRLKSADNFFGGEFWVVIRAGEVPEEETPVAPPAAPPPSSGGAFELGGHVRDLGFPYADKMHYAGMNWSKVQVHYPQDASGIIAASHANGFKIQLSALGQPGMVTEPGFEQKYADWVAQLAAAGADAIEVWNEPNIDREWKLGHISPQAYTSLLCKAYAAIKNANSGTDVISAALSPTGSFGGGCQPNGGNCDDLPFLQGMYNAGAAQCMDYIGAHHNAGATSPSATSGHPADNGGGHHSWYFLPQTQLYYNTFGGTRKLFYTEMGYASQEGVPQFSDWFAWARGTDNAEQAAWLSEAVRLSINTGMVRCIIVWNIDFARYGYDPQDGFAIIRPGGGCPACEALHNVLGTR